MNSDEYAKLFESKIEHLVQSTLEETLDFLKLHKASSKCEKMLMTSSFIDTFVIDLLKGKVLVMAESHLDR